MWFPPKDTSAFIARGPKHFDYLMIISLFTSYITHRDWNVFSWHKAFCWKFREWSVSVLQWLRRKQLWKREKASSKKYLRIISGPVPRNSQWGHAFCPSCGSFVSASFLNYTSHHSSGQLFNKCLFLSKRKPKKNFFKSMQAWGKGSLGRDFAWSPIPLKLTGYNDACLQSSLQSNREVEVGASKVQGYSKLPREFKTSFWCMRT